MPKTKNGNPNKVKVMMFGGLTKLEYDFIHEYLLNGCNGTRAMLKACPDIEYDTASTMATEYLNKPKLIEAMDSIITKDLPEEWILAELRKDIKSKDKALRINALNNVVRIKGMITEKRVDLTKQKEEMGQITYDSFAENPVTEPKEAINVA